MTGSYSFISADSHLETPPDACVHWVPDKYKEWAPRHVEVAPGVDGYVVKDSKPAMTNMSLFAGRSLESFTPNIARWEGTGAGGPRQRLAEQDQDRVDAEVLFAGPHFPGMVRTVKDRAAYHAIIAAYNDWLAQEYCAVAPDRLIGMGLIPISDRDGAIAELEHCKSLGLRGVVLGAFPSGLAYPSAADDRFWAAALDLEMPLTIHVQLFPEPGESLFDYPATPEIPVPDLIERFYRYGTRGAKSVVQMIVGGVFDRFPKLRVYWAENQIGWVPIFTEQFDRQYERNRRWAERLLGLKPLSRKPSEYIREHVYWGFFDDPIGMKLRHEVGVDRIMWSTDFPHVESTWPDSIQLFDEMLEGAPEEERRRIAALNAVEFFGLD